MVIFVTTAMNHVNKVSLKYISAWLFALLFCFLTVQSRDKLFHVFSFHNYLTAATDTIKPGKKLDSSLLKTKIKPDTSAKKNIASAIANDTSGFVVTNDTLDLKFSKDSLEGPVEYTAEDSMILEVPTKKITLYGKKATTHYKDNDLTAPLIEFDQANGNIIASIKRDSLGKPLSMPTYKQADFTSQSDSIKFNLKSGKGITKSTYTKQGEMYVYGEVIKKIDANVFYAKRGRFTTCDLDTPHFAFVSNRIKFITNKVAISGPVHPEFEGVPIPIYLPFGIYPLHQGRHSGFLAPSFTSNQQLGLGLEGLGYYKILSDYWDVVVRGNLYSYGGWSMNINPRYMKRYHYNGRIAFDIQHFNYNFKGDPDFVKNRSFNVQWSHSVDSKARPGVSFSANVNAGSSSYNSFVPNDPYKNFSNQLSSSIVYSKTWKDKPYNLTVSANHNQNTLQKLININLPDVAFNVNTLYPFRKKESAGTPKWYENLGIGYSGNAKSLFSFYDTTSHIFQHILDTFQWGAHHSIPINISLPQVGAFQIAPTVSYDETWYQRKFVRQWNPTEKKLDTVITKGFFTARQMSFGVGISTRIFGLFTAKNKEAHVQAIRHEIRPTIGISYNPNFNKRNYYFTQIDTLNHLQEYSVFEGNVFGPYGNQRFGGINFSLDNNIQMKVRNKKDTGDNALRRVSILDGLSFTTSYNLFADSFQLAPFNVNARSNLFDKISITAGANLDPYDVDSKGNRSKSLLWKRKPISLGRLLSGNVSASSAFQGGSGGKKAAVKPGDLNSNDYAARNGYTNDELNTDLAYIRNNPGEYADFNIPWSVNFSYALRFDRVLADTLGRFKTNFNQDVNLGGTLGLTKKWQMGLNTSYNITQHQIGYLSMFVSREMHCWQLSINIAPVGRYRFFSIYLSPKSALLRDLKVNRTRSYNAF